MLIDFHTHAFPDAIAQRAMDKLSHASGGLVPQSRGTVSSLKTEMEKDGVDVSVVLSIATNPAQQTNVNNFANEINNEEGLFAFGSVHPDADDVFDELERIRDMGLKGVKFHPEYQMFYVDDEKMKPIYKKISSLGLITVFHSGYDYGYAPPYHCMPDNLTGALKWFDAPVIAAHWGALNCGVEVIKKLCGQDVWFDLSFGYGTMPKAIAQEIVDKHTPDRLIFASDMPWHRPAWEKQLIETLDISQSDKDKIYYKNALKLLNIQKV
ncbi:MAG: amidohydrolase family protein [Clostridia bacterium]|nr:amidohydrolase family protein [Clostridia bacterium]